MKEVYSKVPNKCGTCSWDIFFIYVGEKRLVGSFFSKRIKFAARLFGTPE